ncbi:hypothetical protein FJV41_46545 [Myxococcus llanfairpwllgwyngyllgogerychwyrndrobwllllantysiliogogogochensis]|uniref:Uncharacterized protein n=1 Tax=Myxococcus llanfairpwllgwyngyllgogerychwyrndrobwllllantysiliogogogochensis TaxID=2590453 RepID=A0A540WJ93_9BACT|nr:hypothetical protein [Myxococcus llanfairpwllgwyngyllgogerychwyrndrobwllllantysiliogogogochensis]TQF09078.1 hypothetical protein FJV41_46545 [Myxococcus llanfairpwllgwyngyllgogerychwyrndrobwllllantysiliogogogochensis]
MAKTTEQRIARRLQETTGASYNRCLNHTRHVRPSVADGPDYEERWYAAALQALNAPRAR